MLRSAARRGLARPYRGNRSPLHIFALFTFVESDHEIRGRAQSVVLKERLRLAEQGLSQRYDVMPYQVAHYPYSEHAALLSALDRSWKFDAIPYIPNIRNYPKDLVVDNFQT